MTSNDAGATSNSINSPTAPLLTPTLSPAPSLMPSPVSITSDSPNRRPFSDGLLRQPTDVPRPNSGRSYSGPFARASRTGLKRGPRRRRTGGSPLRIAIVLRWNPIDRHSRQARVEPVLDAKLRMALKLTGQSNVSQHRADI